MRDSGMKKVLHLRDGDSERGSGMQEGTETRLGGAQAKRGDCRGHNLTEEVRASIEEGNRA